MDIQRERQQDIQLKSIKDNIPTFIRDSLSSESTTELAAIINDNVSYPEPLMGEVAYSGQSRLTGYGRLGKKELSFYDTSNIPLTVFDAMRRDSQVALGMAIVKFPISNLGFTIDCDNDVIKLACETMMRSLWSRLLKDICLSLDYGFTAFEKVWNRKKFDIDPGLNKHKFMGRDFIWLTKLKALYPITIGVNLDDLNNFIGITQHDAGKDIVLNRQKSMIYTYQEEYGNYFGKSRLVGAYEAWYWKVVSTQFILRYLERHSIPPYAISYPAEMVNTSNGKVSAASIAEAMMRGLSSYGNIILPSAMKDGARKWDVKQVEQSNAQLTPTEILKGWNKDILRGLLLPDKECVDGLDPETATEIFISTLQDILTVAQTQINIEIIEPFVAYNFSKAERVPCTLNIDEIDFKKREEMRKLMSKMMDMSATFMKQTGTLPFDVLPDMNKMCEVLDVPAVKAKMYQPTIYDSEGNIVKLVKKNKPKGTGPDKGESTPGNQAREGANGTPKDPDKQDQQI